MKPGIPSAPRPTAAASRTDGEDGGFDRFLAGLESELHESCSDCKVTRDAEPYVTVHVPSERDDVGDEPRWSVARIGALLTR